MMKKKNLIISLILFLLMGAGFLGAFEKTPFKEEKKQETKKGASSPSELFDANGREVNFEDFQGKIVFINNWASWCPPCVAEMPTIEKLKNSMPAEEVAFVMVSFDRNPKKGLSWMNNKEIDLPVYFPAENFPAAFITEAIPSTFIMDREGNLLHTQVGMADYSSEGFIAQMEEWIKNK